MSKGMFASPSVLLPVNKHQTLALLRVTMGGHSAWRKRVAQGLPAKGSGGAICRHRPHLGRKGKDLILNRKGHIGGGNPKKLHKKRRQREHEQRRQRERRQQEELHQNRLQGDALPNNKRHVSSWFTGLDSDHLKSRREWSSSAAVVVGAILFVLLIAAWALVDMIR